MPLGALALLHSMVYDRLLARRPDGTPFAIIGFDFDDYYYPVLTYVGDALKAHIFPLWCPYVRGGTPFFIHPQNQLYSPVTLLVAPFFGFSQHMVQVQVVFTFLFAGVGAYVLSWALWKDRLAALVAAICFTFTTAIFDNAQHMTVVNAVATFPWLLAACTLWMRDERWWALPLVAFFVYLEIVWGYPGVVLMCFLWTGAYLVWRTLHDCAPGLRARRLGAAVSFAALGFALATVFWLPIVAYRDSFTRGEALPIETVFANALSFKHLLGLVFSFHSITPVVGSDIDPSLRGIYLGALALPLAAVALIVRDRRGQTPAIAIGAGFALLMACGGAFFVRHALHAWVSLFNFSRFPASDSRGIAVLGLALLAGVGASHVATAESDARSAARGGVKALLGALALGFLLYWFWSPKAYADVILPTLMLEVALLTVLAVGLRYFSRRAAAVACVTVLVLEVAWGINVNFDVGAYDPGRGKWLARLAQHQTQFTTAHVEEPRRRLNSEMPHSASAAYLEKTFFTGEYNNFHPRRHQTLLDNHFENWLEKGKRVVFFPGEVPTKGEDFEAQAQPVRYTITSYDPNTVAYDVHADRGGTLVMNEVYFPGWRAWIDGTEVPVVEVAGALRSVAVAAGDHKIVTRFEPRSFLAGLAVTLVSLVATVGATLWMRRRRPRIHVG